MEEIVLQSMNIKYEHWKEKLSVPPEGQMSEPFFSA